MFCCCVVNMEIDQKHLYGHYEPFEDGLPISIFQKNNYDPMQYLRENSERRQRNLEHLRQEHARQRVALAQSLGMMPRFSPAGGLIAPDYYDDGIINGSAMDYDSLYHINKLPHGQIYNRYTI